jgi:hypothetical protein
MKIFKQWEEKQQIEAKIQVVRRKIKDIGGGRKEKK